MGFNVPVDHNLLGSYSWGGFTGIIGAAIAANSEIFQFRWSSLTTSGKYAVIHELSIGAAVSTTFFAAGVPLQIDAIKSTAWTAAGTGGTGGSLGAVGKKVVDFPSAASQTVVRIATTAALGAGTKTLEAEPIGVIVAAGPVAAPGLIFPRTMIIESPRDRNEYPFTLTHQEGVSIRAVAVPGTGTWTAAIHVRWSEYTKAPG